MKIISKAKESLLYNEGYYNGYKLGCEHGYEIGKKNARIKKIIDLACDLSVELTELGDSDLKDRIVKGLADGGYFSLGDYVKTITKKEGKG